MPVVVFLDEWHEYLAERSAYAARAVHNAGYCRQGFFVALDLALLAYIGRYGGADYLRGAADKKTCHTNQ